MFRMATVEQIEEEARRFQTEVGTGFTVTPNSYGVRIECNTCGVSETHSRAYRFARTHGHSVGFTSPRPADYRSETVNSDGTRNVILGWS